MILVKSGRNSFSDRFQLRRILNSSPSLSNFAFLVGTSTGTNKNTQRDDNLLRMEMQEYNDIILADFFDTYENLPLKTKSMYKFATDYCIKEWLLIHRWNCILYHFMKIISRNHHIMGYKATKRPLITILWSIRMCFYLRMQLSLFMERNISIELRTSLSKWFAWDLPKAFMEQFIMENISNQLKCSLQVKFQHIAMDKLHFYHEMVSQKFIFVIAHFKNLSLKSWLSSRTNFYFNKPIRIRYMICNGYYSLFINACYNSSCRRDPWAVTWLSNNSS